MGASEGGEEVPPRMGGHEEKIFVSVRLRPLNRREIARNDVSDWTCFDDNTVVYKNSDLLVPERSMYPTAFTFDRVFSCDCSTRQVYEEGAREIALSVVGGINSSIFAYGQTSSGKTFTMTGITEYTIADIYGYIQKHTEREFILKFSAMEIYNESVRDLLSTDSTPLRLLDDPERGTIVEKLTEETLRDWNHVMGLLSLCEAQRQIGETSLNETSSRSHQIIRLTIESSACELLGKDNSSTLVSAVNFVDLAGSERASQTLSAGTRLKEGCHINRSLLTLGTVIRKLSKGRNGHVPFRDSKLTRILQSSLGANSRTAIICTMSPARSHVEQSRNTLLFASCAKEVSTNAQVNVIMSDKVLVKHLQRELARLEYELNNPESAFLTSYFAPILRERDLKIEKLENDVKDLTLQRDAAQSQVQDILRLFGDERHSLAKVSSGHYPRMHVQRSPEAGRLLQESSTVEDPYSMGGSIRTSGTYRFSGRCSVISFNDNYGQIPVEENFLHNDTSSRLLSSTSHFSESDSCQGSEENEENSNGTYDDVCKVVRCIETEGFSTKSSVKFNYLSTEESAGISALLGTGNRETANQEGMLPQLQEGEKLVVLPLEKGREMVSQSLKVDGKVLASPRSVCNELVSSQMKDGELRCIPIVIPSPEKPSPVHNDQTRESSSSRSLSLTSTSCKSGLTNSLSSPWFEQVENNEKTPPNGSLEYFTRRPRDLPSKVSALNCGTDVDRSSRKSFESSMETVIDIDLEALEKRTSTRENITSFTIGITGNKELPEVHHDKQANKTKVTSSESLKTVKDVGLDPMEDGYRSPSNWPLEFKRLQREIIELWHVCNVSLVHRTYFFLLFKGEPTDSMYMEVELRRLIFLTDTFSQGNGTVEDGRTLTPASSLKKLRRERQMLSKQMQKRLSEHERENLYLKWGVGLNKRNRKAQLAYRLWTNTENMDHIAESAALVAKLVRFTDQEQAPKEMFELNFAPRRSSRSVSLNRIQISLL